MNNNYYNEFVAKLQEIFMMDHAELDFGIYRIMNQKRDDIMDFLENRLLKQVGGSLDIDEKEVVKLQKRQKEILQMAGGDISVLPPAIPLRLEYDANEEQLRKMGNPEELQNEVFSHLVTFFSRYYDGGDFLSKRRYKADTYAIPYNGEEVKLHWANSDQYYIKTSEYFRNYTFELPQSHRKVHFVLKDVSTELNNNKSDKGKERRFAIYEPEDTEEKVVEVAENGDLNIYFTYELWLKATKQEELVVAAIEKIPALLPADFQELITTLMPLPKKPDRTLLEKHLTDYTAKNSFDYFIHKNLGAFLKRELDFYLKNEVINIDDLDDINIKKRLGVAKAIKNVGIKIIQMLAQLEDFQKKLWLKKKFVVQSDYCITLDRVPKELYPYIIANEAQRKEWVRLFAINEIKGDLMKEAYSEPLTVEFLKQNPYLVLDTAFFDVKFKHQLIASMENLDEHTNGLLINSENFQALKLLQEKYTHAVKSIYVDPPYNTSASEIAYKNNYKNSTWLSLMDDRLRLGKNLLTKDGIQCTTIDDVEQNKLNLLLEDVFEEQPEAVAIRIKPSGRPIPNGFAISHEYGLFSKANEDVAIARLPRSDEQLARYRELDEKGPFFWEMLRKAGSNSHRTNRPTMYYPIYWNDKYNKFRIPDMEYDEDKKEYIINEKPDTGEIALYPIKDDKSEGCWYFGIDNIKDHIDYLKAEVQENGLTYVYYRRRPNEGVQPLTTWGDAKYSATEHGTDLLKKMDIPFDYPKSIYAVEDCLRVSGCHREALVLDYFGGSGTTSHAVINLNKIDEGQRKYILCDMAKYFDPALRTRTERAIYSEDWDNGKPVSRKGVSQCFKYIRLEQYEDTLNNLKLQKQELEFEDNFKDGYMLNYLLNTEAQGSLLNLKMFVNPFNNELNITRNNEQTPTKVDLVDTFNYLIGLNVEKERWFEDDNICIVTGVTHRDHRRIMVIWRNQEIVGNGKLTELFEKPELRELAKDVETIYVNGENTLQSKIRDGENWQVMLTDEEFLNRMFEEA
jgi:adenine-specific DNA-methyltransferase